MGQIQTTINLCELCGKRWFSDGELPKRCSKCKSTKWNAASGTPGGENALAQADGSAAPAEASPAEACALCPKLEAKIEKRDAEIAKLRERLANAEESGSVSSFGGAGPAGSRSEKKAAREKRQKGSAEAVSGFLTREAFKACEHGNRPDLCRKEACRKIAPFPPASRIGSGRQINTARIGTDQPVADCAHPSNHRIGTRLHWRCTICGQVQTQRA